MNGFEGLEPIQIPASRRGQHHHHVLVRRLDHLVSLTDDDAAALATLNVGVRQVGPHTDLFHEGDAPDEVLLVLDGFAARCKLQPSGKRQILAYMLPGDLCDADAEHLSRRDFSVCTLSACLMASIPRRTLASTLEQHPRIARAMRLAKLQEEAIGREWLVNVGCRSAIKRLAHLLCELLERLRAVGSASKDSYTFPITQQDLGDTLGLSNVHVNRMMRELREMKLATLQGRQLTILDLPRLHTLAVFNPKYMHSINKYRTDASTHNLSAILFR